MAVVNIDIMATANIMAIACIIAASNKDFDSQAYRLRPPQTYNGSPSNLSRDELHAYIDAPDKESPAYAGMHELAARLKARKKNSAEPTDESGYLSQNGQSKVQPGWTEPLSLWGAAILASGFAPFCAAGRDSQLLLGS